MGRLAVALGLVGGAILMIPSCASILGIEDLQGGEADGGGVGVGGKDGGVSGSGGGSSSTGGAAGASGGGGSSATGGTGGTGMGGASGTGGEPSDAAGGGLIDARVEGGAGSTGGQDAPADVRVVDAGDSGSTGVTVQGTVIGYFKHRVPNVQVSLGTRTTTTDSSGHFTFTNVTPPYDIGLAVRGYRVAAWMFKGLTRTDPVLQVKDAFDPWANTSNYHFQNYPASDAGAVPRSLMIAFGSPDTTFSFGIYQPDGTDYTYSYDSWEGTANSTMGTAHALLWETPIADTVSPTRYVAYDAKALSLLFNTPSSTTFDMAPDNTPADMVSGSISSFATDRHLDGYVRFDSGAIMHIVKIDNAPASFSMLMPKIPNATVSVGAVSGSTPDGPYAVAHRDGITPGTAGVQLTVPQPASLMSPLGGATGVGPSTTFQWNGSGHVAIIGADCDGPTQTDYHTFFYTVVADTHGQLPSLDGNPGIPLPKNRQCYWWVEVHGDYATVDAATTAAGMLDPYTYYSYGEFQGPARDNSTYSVSASRGFTTAP